MIKGLRRFRAAAVLAISGALFVATNAQAGQSLVGALTHGKPLIDIRTRFESVDDENCAACAGRAAEAVTIRARVGYETAKWYQLSALIEFDKVFALGGEHYNSTRNGMSLYPVVADPDLIALNRLQLSYQLGLDTKFVLGRQRIIFGNSRFVGNVGWRQHEQTYDGVTITNGSIRNLTLTYAYIDKVNRVFGPDDPVPAAGQPSYYDSRSHLINALFVGIPNLKLEGYAYILDLKQPGPSPLVAKRLSTATFGIRAMEKFELTPSVNVLLNAEYAYQADHDGNPLSIDLNYWLGEAGFTYKGLTALGAYESLGGNGTVGFSTPLATLHAFNGWADVFLVTPVNGLENVYGKIAYKFKKPVKFLEDITVTAVYHDFRAERGGADYGTEWDASIDVAIDKNVSLTAKYANFDGVGAFRDKTIFWLQANYKL